MTPLQWLDFHFDALCSKCVNGSVLQAVDAQDEILRLKELLVSPPIDIGPQQIPVNQRNYAAWGGFGEYRDGLD